MDIDPEITASYENGLFGIPTEENPSKIVILPVPWEATTSYGDGASQGPEAVLKASPQLDLFVDGMDEHYQKGFHLLEVPHKINTLNKIAKPLAQNVIESLEKQGHLSESDDDQKALEQVNQYSADVNEFVYETSKQLLEKNKIPAVLGGDHSSPYGLIKAICEHNAGEEIGILHIDAHLDLRDSYQGFEFSHASIMKNCMEIPTTPPAALVQLGIRDYCKSEAEYARQHSQIFPYYDLQIKQRMMSGESVAEIFSEALSHLPKKVYISFDIDGLKPNLCPNTGTPVPGGLEFEESILLIKALVESHREIVGFDLCEVAPDPTNPENEWDGNVGARILFFLCQFAIESQKNV